MDRDAVHRAPGKRGRRQGVPDPGRGPAAAFGYALAALKVAAGDPSYERMRTELGAAASKSALSAAARGRDLPSWETAWEFVRCLAPPGGDVDGLRREWRARWEAARCTAPDAAPAAPPGPQAPDPAAHRDPARRHPWFPPERRLLAVGLAVGLTVGGLLWLLVAAAGPVAPPVPGDAAAFVADVTVPDGAEVRPDERFVKTWELRNAGTVAWTGRYLLRLPGAAGAGCRTPARVPVPATAPGATVRVSVPVQAPPGPTTCIVHWKMVDDRDRAFFPLARPVFFDVRVVDPGQ